MERQSDALVSIIVPVYNIALYVEECIESIRRQTYHNIEIIVVDDGSEDGSGERCEEIAAQDERIKVIRQKNMGVAAARGKGIEQAAGEYIMFVDGDDWIEPDMVEALVKYINHADLVTSGVYYQEKADRMIKRYDEFSEGIYADKERMDEFLKTMIYDSDKEGIQRLTPWSVNKLYRSGLAKEVYQRIDMSITFAEDSVFLYRYLLRCSSVVIVHQCYYHYRFRGDSAMHAVNNHMLMDINKVYLALEPDFRKHELSENLLFQLQKWIIVMCIRAVNSHMGFEEKAYIPEFIADLSDVRDKKLVLYGAGLAGQNTYDQLKRFKHEVVLWADKNYMLYQSKGMPVVSPGEILSKDYDVVLIAVNEQALADRIRKELSEMGVSEGCLLWRKPMRV